ncbi:hypothetical protein LAC03_17720 [Levilactobacillus acidifarinae]|nr:hypothetical protein LAC03_17720 [Levilactobacillus acidifarinae]
MAPEIINGCNVTGYKPVVIMGTDLAGPWLGGKPPPDQSVTSFRRLKKDAAGEPRPEIWVKLGGRLVNDQAQ